jgi:uncharacterized membrane protein (DUF4010 family)
VRFVILSLLVLPFLPDIPYGPDNILNPRNIGTVVVVVSAISFLGYILNKFGNPKKGILFTAFLGGLFSSTALTWNYSLKSRETPELSPNYSAGIILASTVMLFRVAVLALLFNPALIKSLWLPCAMMAAAGIISVILIVRKSSPKTDGHEIPLGNPLDILSALYFAILFVCISVMVYYTNEFFGKQGLYLAGLISGLADVDAITISMAHFASAASQLEISVAVILIAMLSNTLVKLVVALVKASPQSRKYTAAGLAFMLAAGLSYLFFFWLNLR